MGKSATGEDSAAIMISNISLATLADADTPVPLSLADFCGHAVDDRMGLEELLESKVSLVQLYRAQVSPVHFPSVSTLDNNLDSRIRHPEGRVCTSVVLAKKCVAQM